MVAEEIGMPTPQAFPLQAVLEQRRHLEEQRRHALAQAEMRLAQARAAEKLLQAGRAAAAAELAQAQQAQSVDVYTLQAAISRLARAEGEVMRAHLAADGAASHAEAARAALTVASQSRLALERLRDAFEETARREAARIEAERLGEMALLRWYNRRTES